MKKYFDKYSIRLSNFYPYFFILGFVYLISQYNFLPLESVLYDFRIRNDFGIGHRDDFVLVVLDEESDEFLGEKYPYTYASHYKAIQKLIKDRPKVVNYLLALEEPDSELEIGQQKLFKNEVETFIHGNGYFRFGTDMDAWGEQLPPTNLRNIGHSLSLINVDNAQFSRDDVTRRAVLTVTGENSLHLWSANAFRESKGESSLDPNKVWGAYYVREADAMFVMFRYFSNPLPSSHYIKTIPFHRLLVGNFPRGFFEDKIVLVGPAYAGNTSDFVSTPFGRDIEKSTKLNIHAQIIESLVQNKTVYPLPKWVSILFSLFFSLGLSYFISKANPGHGLGITVASMVAVIVLAYFLFCFFGIWVYLSHIVTSIFAVYYIWVPFRAIEEYQRRYAIQEETKLLRQVENLKQNFISLMSHDLKTPVARIAGIVDNLLKHNLTEECKIELNKIVTSTKELNKFITSILDLTKIESSNLKLDLVSRDVNTIIKTVSEELKHEANLKNIKMNLELGPLYPIQIDMILMKRVFSNIIENALKYCGSDKTVHVKTWDDSDFVYVQVSDNGIGIKAEDLKHIFDKFYRVKNDSSHTVKGTGLGLYLVKYFVELHGGTISADSEVGKGTTFTVKLKNA